MTVRNYDIQVKSKEVMLKSVEDYWESDRIYKNIKL